jgi:hypothetical protein
MTTDPKECSENAKRCVTLAAKATDPVVLRLKLAAETIDPVLKDNLLNSAKRWERLAAELEPENAWLALKAKPLKRSN